MAQPSVGSPRGVVCLDGCDMDFVRTGRSGLRGVWQTLPEASLLQAERASGVDDVFDQAGVLHPRALRRQARQALMAPKAVSLMGELAHLSEMMQEQTAHADARARADARKISATWMGMGDHLLLLVVDATSTTKIKRKLYKCRVLEVVEEIS